MTPDPTRYTLGELLAHHNTIITRAAMSILKTLQRAALPESKEWCAKHTRTRYPNKATGDYYCNSCTLESVTGRAMPKEDN